MQLNRIQRRVFLRSLLVSFSAFCTLETVKANTQSETCTYFEFTNTQIDNVIEWYDGNGPEEHISILQNMMSESSDVTYLYEGTDSYYYDNGDVTTTVPPVFMSNIRILYENTRNSAEFEDYFTDVGEVGCNRIPFDTEVDSSGPTNASTPEPTETSTPGSTSIPTAEPTNTPTPAPTQISTAAGTATGSQTVGGILTALLVGIFSTEALVVVGISIIVVLIVQTWPDDE